MAQAVTMYRWDDEGAPQVVDGKPSEYMNVLKKCLVEGYGAKSSLGWSVVEEIASPPYLAIKNDINVGSGGVAILSASNDAAGQSTKVYGVQDYIDQNTQYRSSPFSGFDRNSTSQYMINKWFLIGTGRAFYFFVYSEYTMGSNATGARSVISFFMGDFDSLYPNDPATFTHIAGAIDSTSNQWNYSLNNKISESNLSSISRIHPIDGTEQPLTLSLVSLFGTSAHVNGAYNNQPNITILSPCYLMMGNGSINSSASYQNNIKPYVRGILPGLNIANSAGYRSDAQPVIKILNNANHYLIPSTQSYTGCAWINLEEW
ncbi:hypothetical protein [Pseudoalteromonas rhizosphaerae]|uniref:hypothetical protein n=1 Tax=Pseudoalteromonas rhizosphaerae TaxID=2518973 RepID=UPI00384D4A46